MIVSETRGLRTWLKLTPGVKVGRDASGRLYLMSDRRMALGAESDELTKELDRLADGRQAADEPSALNGCDDSPPLAKLHDEGFVSAMVEYDGVPLFTRHCLSPSNTKPQIDPGGAFVLSSLVVLHRQRNNLVLESAIAASSLVIHASRMLQLIGALAMPAKLDEVTGDWPLAVATAVIERLVSDGFVVPASADQDIPQEDTGWSAHESWFHARSRWGGHASADYVGPYENPAERGLPPALRPAYPGLIVALPRPELDQLAAADPPLALVMEQRRSIRSHDTARPITIAEVGEFLFRTARVRTTFEYKGGEYTKRPYPCSGTAYELELYLAVGSVRGLDPGLYHYDPKGHGLETVPSSAAQVGRLLEQAKNTAMMPNDPQVLVVISARFGRILSKYRGMGYAAMLKDVGVLYQTMYLVGSAMGIAPCALGNGDTATFAAATGTDYLQESSVGEFLLGSQPQA